MPTGRFSGSATTRQVIECVSIICRAFAASSSGAIVFIAAPDYEAKNSYSFSVSVSDGTLTASKSLTVNINNINEPPTLSTNAVTMDDNIALIPGLTLTDPEGGALSALVYSSRGHAADLEGLENEVLGNEDGSVLIINQDTEYDSTKIIKLVSAEIGPDTFIFSFLICFIALEIIFFSSDFLECEKL